MLFRVDDAGLQRQMDVVQEELREVRLLKELFSGPLTVCVPDGSACLLRQEKQIQRRISFLEKLRASAVRLHAEVEKDMDAVTEQMRSIKSGK